MGCKGGCGGGSIQLKLFTSAAHEAFESIVSHTYAVPMFGTLLGLAREGDLIVRDRDLDFYTVDPISVIPPGMFLSYNESDGGGITQDSFQWSERKRLFIDLFQPVPEGDEYRVRIVHRTKPKGATNYRFPKAWLDDLEMVDLDWCEVLLPTHRREILEHVYGSGWQTKDYKWRHPRD